jgi:hypothetical protein
LLLSLQLILLQRARAGILLPRRRPCGRQPQSDRGRTQTDGDGISKRPPSRAATHCPYLTSSPSTPGPRHPTLDQTIRSSGSWKTRIRSLARGISWFAFAMS